MLIPLQLALITDVLVQSPGMSTYREFSCLYQLALMSDIRSGTLPWKQILVLITFTALNSPGGLPVAREYMWLPLHKHSYHKISTDVFNKITTSFSEPPGSKRSRDLWETVKHGRSFGHAVRSVMFQLSPAVVDIALATLVLGFVFGFPMMAIIAVVLCGLVLTILIFPMRNRGAWQMAADVDEERNVFCEAVSSHRDAVEYYEKFRYEAAVMDRTNSTLRCFQWFHLESVMQSFLLIVGFTGACLLAAYKVAFDNMPLGNVVMLLAFCVQLSIDLKSSKREMIFVVQRYWDAVKLVSLLKMKPSIRRSQNRARPARVDEPIGPRDNPFTTKYGASALNVAKLSAEHPTRIGTSDAFANIHSTAQFNDGGRVQEGGEHNLIHFQEPESVHPAAEISERDRAHQSDDGNMAGFQELADVRSMALINEGDQLQPAEDSAEPESQKSAEIQPANEAITGGRAATDESYESKELQQMNETTSGDRAAIGEIQSMDEINGADEIQQKDDQAVVEDLSKSPDVHPEGQNIDGGQVQQKDEFAEIEGPHVSAEGPADKADQEDEVAKVERSLESTDCHEHIDGGEAKVIIGPWESSDEEQIDGDDAAVIAGPYESDDEEHIDGGEAAVIAGSCESTESHKEHINGDDVAVTAGPCESADGEHIDGEQINGSEYQQKDDSAGIGHSHDYAKTPASVGVGKPLRASAKPFVFPTQENLMDYFPKEMLREGSLNNGRAPTKKMAWKPDAPEFIPASQRSVAKKSQTMEEHKSANNESEGVEKLYLGRYEIKKENRGGVQNENVPTAGGDKKKDMEIAGDGSHGFGSVLEQSTNGVVLRSPRKPRKRNKGKRKVVFRRSLTKSEPSGVGLARFE